MKNNMNRNKELYTYGISSLGNEYKVYQATEKTKAALDTLRKGLYVVTGINLNAIKQKHSFLSAKIKQNKVILLNIHISNIKMAMFVTYTISETIKTFKNTNTIQIQTLHNIAGTDALDIILNGQTVDWLCKKANSSIKFDDIWHAIDNEIQKIYASNQMPKLSLHAKPKKNYRKIIISDYRSFAPIGAFLPGLNIVFFIAYCFCHIISLARNSTSDLPDSKSSVFSDSKLSLLANNNYSSDASSAATDSTDIEKEDDYTQLKVA